MDREPMDLDSEEVIIRLQSSDGKIFQTDIKAAKCFKTIKTMLEELGTDSSEEIEIPLPNVNSAILRKVLEWADFHKNDPVPVEDDQNKEKSSDDISLWDREFLQVNQDILFELITAANYLEGKGLLDAICKTIANMIKCKSPEVIRETFNIVNDFTPEDEERILTENFWCQELNRFMD